MCELCPSIICAYTHSLQMSLTLGQVCQKLMPKSYTSRPNLFLMGRVNKFNRVSTRVFFFFFFQLSEIAIMARIKHSSWLKWLVSWNVCTRGRQLGFVFSKHLVIYICIFWISIIWLLQNVQWSLIWLCVSSPPKKTRWF